MKRLKLDEVRELLPALDELRPVLDLLLLRSEPDARHAWTRSGEVESAGDRLLPEGTALSGAAELAEREGAHLLRLYQAVGRALRALEAGAEKEAAAALLDAAALEEGRDRPERAEAWSDAALRLVRGLRDRAPAALALRRSARAARARGHLEAALARYRECFRTARAIADPRGAAEAAVGAGNVLEQQGRWAEAEVWYLRALDELDGVEGHPPERWHALLNLHIARRSRGALEDSLAFLERAEEAARAAGEVRAALPFLENARGQLHLWAGRLEAAEAAFREALAAATSTAATVTIRLNLAEALLARGHLLEAAEEAREAEREALAGGVVGSLAEVYRLLGRIASRGGNPEAFVLFERALDLVHERRLPVLEEALTLQAYAEHEERLGEPDAARSLRERARARYRALGIEHLRHPWTEYFGPSSDPAPTGGGHDDDPVETPSHDDSDA